MQEINSSILASFSFDWIVGCIKYEIFIECVYSVCCVLTVCVRTLTMHAQSNLKYYLHIWKSGDYGKQYEIC